MKKLFLTVLIMCCSTAFGQGVKISTGGAIAFNKPVIDTTVLPDASTTVMLHFEDNYEDLGGSTWANGINPWSGFSTTRRFGGFSAYHQTSFNTTSHFFTSSDASPELVLGTGDFTVEFWAGIDVISSSGGTSDNILTFSIQNGAAAAFFTVYNVYSGNAYVPGLRFQDTGGTNFSGTYTGYGFFSGLNWFHACFERRSGTLYCYINGQQVAAGTMAYDISAVTGADFAAHNRNYLSARFYIDEFRVFKSGYVYGGEFTPPSEPFGIKKNNRLNFRGAQ